MQQDYWTYRHVSTRALIETALSYSRTPLEEYAGKVSADTLLVAGGKDGIAPPSAVARLHEAMPLSLFTVLGNAGHLVPVEEPAEIARVLNEFLAPRLASRMTIPTAGVGPVVSGVASLGLSMCDAVFGVEVQGSVFEDFAPGFDAGEVG